MLKHIKEYEEYNFLDDTINEGLGDLWDRFKKAVGDFFSRKKTIIKKPGVKAAKIMDPTLITGEHMIYLTHQQGPTGLANIMDILRGEVEIQQDSRDKLLNNMPQSDTRYAKVKNGKSKEAVKAFLEYQQSTWGQYKKEALAKINEPQNAKVKQAIEKAKSKIPEFSKDFITTVAYKESRFNPDPKTNKAYRGLFQIGDSAWTELKRIYPSKYSGIKAPLSPIKNTEAGCDYLKLVYDRFEKLIKN
jgi:hypothetical protein